MTDSILREWLRHVFIATCHLLKILFQNLFYYKQVSQRATIAYLSPRWQGQISFQKTYILDKSSNRPLSFYPFSSKPTSTLQLYLHPQVGRCVSQFRNEKVLQNSEYYMQDAPMNTGTPIFKIHKIQHFVTVCRKSLPEISNFHEQNHFITKAYDWRNKCIQKWTIFRHDTGCYGPKC